MMDKPYMNIIGLHYLASKLFQLTILLQVTSKSIIKGLGNDNTILEQKK